MTNEVEKIHFECVCGQQFATGLQALQHKDDALAGKIQHTSVPENTSWIKKVE